MLEAQVQRIGEVPPQFVLFAANIMHKTNPNKRMLANFTWVKWEDVWRFMLMNSVYLRSDSDRIQLPDEYFK